MRGIVKEKSSGELLCSVYLWSKAMACSEGIPSSAVGRFALASHMFTPAPSAAPAHLRRRRPCHRCPPHTCVSTHPAPTACCTHTRGWQAVVVKKQMTGNKHLAVGRVAHRWKQGGREHAGANSPSRYSHVAAAHFRTCSPFKQRLGLVGC